jgi:lycopene cyclase domain-containing protein
MTQWVYLLTLLAALACLALVDRRWRLLLWADSRRAVVVLALGVALFLVWDVAALRSGLYRRGDSRWMSGLEVAPDLPVEELFFVLFLCYLTMVLHRLVSRFVAPDRGSEDLSR